MSDTIVFLQLEHGTLTKLLDLVDSLRDEIESGKEPDFGLLKLLFSYFRDYPDACHHPKEDVVFRALRRKAPELAQDIGNLIGDHEALALLTEQVSGEVDAAARGGTPSAEFVASLRGFVRAYRGHLEAEEREFFPVAAKQLDKSDWTAIDFDVFDRADPLYDESSENRFRDLRRAIWKSAATGTPPNEPNAS